MADTTWGVKVPEELKEKLSQVMQGSGLSGKDFVESMLQAYIIQEMSENQPIMAPDLKELQVVTNRIVAIYANLGERLSNVITDKDNWFNAELEKKEKSINVLGETHWNHPYPMLIQKKAKLLIMLELKKQKRPGGVVGTHRALSPNTKKNDTSPAC